ncbi:calcium homeostasis modulator protein 6-like [Eucyclogobius newberryi]|uniref:calcium homeostasis modulator protein 6-like n=1 Tax=Eucyclogobius newberryi TaxID=166745 RepID=UPI003B5BF3A6
MEAFKNALKVFAKSKDNVGVYVTLIVTAAFHLMFHRNFACSCRPQKQDQSCFLHLVLPVLLLWVILLLLDKGLQRMCYRLRCDGSLWVMMARIIRAACVSMIWVASVLVDGEWWLCCQNNGTTLQATVACTPPSERTMEEKSISAELRSQSRNYGLVVLLAAATLALSVSFVRPCYTKSNGELTAVILEEGQKLVFDQLHAAAMQRLTERVQTRVKQREWVQCSKEVGELIKEMTSPKEQDEEVILLQQGSEVCLIVFCIVQYHKCNDVNSM